MTYVLNKALKIKEKTEQIFLLLVIHVNASVKMIAKKKDAKSVKRFAIIARFAQK